MLANFEWACNEIHTHNEVSTAIDEILSKDVASTGVILSLGSLYLQGNILNYLGKDTDEDLSLLPKQ